ncbi:MAG: hypothetical protein O3C57_01200 [Verrucomicrobia bacterium]|nr:hypothetical protein [Verrucomicrobiota bacterium]
MNATRRLLNIASVCVFGLPVMGVVSARADDVDFGKDIYPILRNHCLSCHAEAYIDAEKGVLKEPKEGLRLDTPEWIQKGYLDEDDGTRHEVIVPGKPLESKLYVLTSLDPEDEDIMPAKGEPLTIAQQTLIKDWIAQGAKVGDFVAPKYVNPKAKQ